MRLPRNFAMLAPSRVRKWVPEVKENSDLAEESNVIWCPLAS